MRYDPIPAFITQAVAEIITPTLIETVIEPEVSPGGIQFSSEVDSRIRLQYADRALTVNNFELFMDLLHEIASTLGLVPATDLPKIAALLNAMRVEKNLEPL